MAHPLLAWQRFFCYKQMIRFVFLVFLLFNTCQYKPNGFHKMFLMVFLAPDLVNKRDSMFVIKTSK